MAVHKRIILKYIFMGTQGLDWSGLTSRCLENDLHRHPYTSLYVALHMLLTVQIGYIVNIFDLQSESVNL